jgi:hypothetical protein
MAKLELPIKAFEDLLNIYVSNGRFPWKHKMYADENGEKKVAVQQDGTLSFMAYLPEAETETSKEVGEHIYSVAEVFSIESGIHYIVNWKAVGDSRQRNEQPPIYDVGYSFHYMTMAAMTIGQKMQYFIDMTELA